MGCGHSKINIYPKRNRNKNATTKKTVSPASEKVDAVEEEVDNNAEPTDENIQDDDPDKRTIKVKPYGGPLIAHPELSASQNNFFKMLDDKIENGPDYDSSSENEKALEKERLTTLLRDWETASAGSRSLPVTPKRRPLPTSKSSASAMEAPLPPQQRILNQSIIHQSYGVTPYRQAAYATPIYQPQQMPHHHPQQAHPAAQYSSAMQYQALSSLYGRQYSQQAALLGSSPVKSYTAAPAALTSSPKHIPSYQVAAGAPGPDASPYSPKMLYKGAARAGPAAISNGDLIQQQIYQQQLQYQQARDYQHYKQAREQQLIQHQQHQEMQAQSYNISAAGVPVRAAPYQSSGVHIPIVAQNDITQYDVT